MSIMVAQNDKVSMLTGVQCAKDGAKLHRLGGGGRRTRLEKGEHRGRRPKSSSPPSLD